MGIHIRIQVQFSGATDVQVFRKISGDGVQHHEAAEAGGHGRIAADQVPSVAIQVQLDAVAAQMAAFHISRQVLRFRKMRLRAQVYQRADLFGNPGDVPGRDIHRHIHLRQFFRRYIAIGSHNQVQQRIGTDVLCGRHQFAGVIVQHIRQAAGVYPRGTLYI